MWFLSLVPNLRDWSVYAGWIRGQADVEYLKIRPRSGGMRTGVLVDVQRKGEDRWRLARVVESWPSDRNVGSIVYLTLVSMRQCDGE